MLTEFIRYATDAFIWIMAFGFLCSSALAMFMAVNGVRNRDDIPFALIIVFCGLILLGGCVGLCFLGVRILQ